eukprot:2755707-Pyramimonas_sp.AAC.1
MPLLSLPPAHFLKLTPPSYRRAARSDGRAVRASSADGVGLFQVLSVAWDMLRMCDHETNRPR